MRVSVKQKCSESVLERVQRVQCHYRQSVCLAQLPLQYTDSLHTLTRVPRLTTKSLEILNVKICQRTANATENNEQF